MLLVWISSVKFGTYTHIYIIHIGNYTENYASGLDIVQNLREL